MALSQGTWEAFAEARAAPKSWAPVAFEEHDRFAGILGGLR